LSDGLWQVVALLFTIGLGLITVGFIAVVLETKQWKPVLWGVTSIATGAILVFVVIVILMGGTISRALARDLDGRYAASPLKPWFDTPEIRQGPLLLRCRWHRALRRRLEKQGRALSGAARRPVVGCAGGCGDHRTESRRPNDGVAGRLSRARRCGADRNPLLYARLDDLNVVVWTSSAG
jgi:hypothetical protein